MSKEFAVRVFVTAFAFAIVLLLIVCASIVVAYSVGIRNTGNIDILNLVMSQFFIGVIIISFSYFIVRLLSCLRWIWKTVSK